MLSYTSVNIGMKSLADCCKVYFMGTYQDTRSCNIKVVFSDRYGEFNIPMSRHTIISGQLIDYFNKSKLYITCRKLQIYVSKPGV